jgi:hypothetical protein
MSRFEGYHRHDHGYQEGESQGSNYEREAKEKGETDSAISSMGNASGEKDNAVYYHEGTDDPTGDAGEKAGHKSISHKFKLKGFEHFSSPTFYFSKSVIPARHREPLRRGGRNLQSSIAILVLLQDSMGHAVGNQIHRTTLIGHLQHLLSYLGIVVVEDLLIYTGD